MRKLALLTTLCAAAAVPAIAFAADGSVVSSAATTGPTLVVHDLGDPLQVQEARRQLRIAKRRARPPRPEPVAVPAHLQAIAQCESGGDPTAIGGGGLYRGKYQFSVATWQAVGGTGDPAAAPETEQDRRAIILYNTSGPGQWPVCGS
ncbi:MAG TPA: transglycosylase family protein [Thermoleophilaceae bacterium]|nr:transglycosylase family protein [Thermoleophilaceae bacterium]